MFPLVGCNISLHVDVQDGILCRSRYVLFSPLVNAAPFLAHRSLLIVWRSVKSFRTSLFGQKLDDVTSICEYEVRSKAFKYGKYMKVSARA